MKTNANSANYSPRSDWAEADRRRFLRSISKAKKNDGASLTNGRANSVWMIDVSASDKRSVKAYLAGRGDFRSAWWNLNEYLHRLLRPASCLESAMYHFHKRHGELTLWRLSAAKDFWTVFAAIRAGDFSTVIAFVQDQLRGVVKAKR